MNSRWYFALSFATLTCVSSAQIVTLYPVADLRILSFAPNTNDNRSGLSTFRSLGNTQRTLIKFDLSPLAKQQILTATLRLRGSSFGGSVAATAIEVYRLTSSWSETTATWNSKLSNAQWTNPGGDAVGRTGSQLSNPYTRWQGNASSSAKWFEIDATDLVSEWTNSNVANHGLLLSSDIGNELVFVSREGNNFDSTLVGEPTDIPELVVRTVAEPKSLLVATVFVVFVIVRKRS